MFGLFLGSKRKDVMKVLSLVEEVWEWKSSDDVWFVLFVFIDLYVILVILLKNFCVISLVFV